MSPRRGKNNFFKVNRGRTLSAASASAAPFPAATYGEAPLRQPKRRCKLITTLGRNNMAATGGRASAAPAERAYATPPA